MENKPSPVMQPEPQVFPLPRRVKRPWSVTWLALGVLIITVINLTRFILSLRYWSFLTTQPGPSPFYLAISGFIWSVAGSVLLWGLWKPANWAPRLMEAEALTYALYYWLDLLFVRDHPVANTSLAMRTVLPANWQFSAWATVICLVFIMWVLGRSKVKAYFSQAAQGMDIPQAGDVQEDGKINI
jgi:hypothetical protein